MTPERKVVVITGASRGINTIPGMPCINHDQYDIDAAVQDVVRAQADDIEDKRRLPDPVIAVLRESGLNRLAIPAALGGREAPVREMVKSVEAVAMVDGSAGWCAAIGAGSNVFAGYLPEAGARHVFADPDQGNATMFAPTGTVDVKGRGGRLTGRWAFTSNCLHSAWAGLGATVRCDGEAEPLPRVVFVPLAELTVEDTWNAPGLRGTGSHHVSAGDVVVDLDHSCRLSDRAWPDGALWRLPIYTVLIPVLAAVPIGIARGALDEVFRLAREGRNARRGQLSDDPIGMAELAIADTDLRAIRAALLDALDEAHARAERGDPVNRQLQARILLTAMRSCDVAVEVTSIAHALGGAAAVYAGSRLLRALLDVQTGRQHLLFGHQHRPAIGAALAGRDVTYPPFLM
jgi:alkylation response protein AidB-like acyl-CoA dehydrogenase